MGFRPGPKAKGSLVALRCEDVPGSLLSIQPLPLVAAAWFAEIFARTTAILEEGADGHRAVNETHVALAPLDGAEGTIRLLQAPDMAHRRSTVDARKVVAKDGQGAERRVGHRKVPNIIRGS